MTGSSSLSALLSWVNCSPSSNGMYSYMDMGFVKAACALLLYHLLCFSQGDNPVYGVGSWQPQQARVFVLASEAAYGFGSSECVRFQKYTLSLAGPGRAAVSESKTKAT